VQLIFHVYPNKLNLYATFSYLRSVQKVFMLIYKAAVTVAVLITMLFGDHTWPRVNPSSKLYLIIQSALQRRHNSLLLQIIVD
jgi:hypothetical protein